MNKIKMFFIGGALLWCSLPIIAKPYYLYYYTGVENGQKTPKGSKTPRRPLRVDYTNNVLTIPDQLVGYTLIVTDEDGNEFSCFLTNNVVTLPANFVGELNILLTDSNQTFNGIIDAD